MIGVKCTNTGIMTISNASALTIAKDEPDYCRSDGGKAISAFAAAAPLVKTGRACANEPMACAKVATAPRRGAMRWQTLRSKSVSGQEEKAMRRKSLALLLLLRRRRGVPSGGSCVSLFLLVLVSVLRDGCMIFFFACVCLTSR